MKNTFNWRSNLERPNSQPKVQSRSKAEGKDLELHVRLFSQMWCQQRWSCIGFMVCGWVQILECGQLLARTFICGYQLRKCVPLWFLPRNIYGQTAEVAVISRLRLTIQIQKLKYKMISLNSKAFKYKSSL